MAERETGGLEKALEDWLDGILNDFLLAIDEKVRTVVREEIAGLGATVGGAPPAPAPAPAPVEAASAAAPAALGSLNESLSLILQPASQTDIMGATLQRAKAYAGRCALFVRRGETLSFWRAEGFAADALSRLRSLVVPIGRGGMFEALESQPSVSGQRSEGRLPPNVQQALGDAVEDAFLLLPIRVQGRVVGVIYADSGATAGSLEPAALEILATIAGLSVETSGSRAATGKTAARPSQAAAMAPVSAAPPPAAAEAQAAPEPVLPPPPDPDSLPEEERDAHKRAHRFARVAVQDLMSYHKAKITAGRTDLNLYLVLKDDIDKTRENYKQRFGGTPARSFDYLHYELVSKLAENNPDALGQQYPGPLSPE